MGAWSDQAGLRWWPRGSGARVESMTDAATAKPMSAAEYLEWERQQLDKHEFHNGEIFAMAGGSPRHAFLALAIGAELRAVVREHGCSAMSADMRIAAEPLKRYVYADAVVVCGPLQYEANTTDV